MYNKIEHLHRNQEEKTNFKSIVINGFLKWLSLSIYNKNVH